MTWVLATLAALILLTIPLGLWPLFHIEPLFEHWLHPVVGAATESLDWKSATDNMFSLELGLALASVALALLSWLFARWVYLDARNPLPARLLANTSALVRTPYRVIYNKYFVDEMYDVAIVRQTRRLCRWLFVLDQRVIDGLVNFAGLVGRTIASVDGLIDTLLVDGLVNGIASGAAAVGGAIRKLHTGRIQTYLVGALAGAIVLVFINFFLF